jgi:beta-lactamase class A
MSKNHKKWAQGTTSVTKKNKRLVSGSRMRRWGHGTLLILTGTIVMLGGFFQQAHSTGQTVLASPANTEQSATLSTDDTQPTRTVRLAEGTDVFEQINTMLSDWQAQHTSTTWSVSVSQVGDTTKIAALNDKKPMYIASLYKLLLVRPLKEKVTPELWAQTTLPGTNSTIASCVDLMIRVSDNTCGEAMADYIGWNTIQKAARKEGLQSVNLRATDFSATAQDMASLLDDLYSTNPDAAKEQVLSAMQKQKYKQGIVAGCKTCVTYTKTGELRNVRHDIGIVKINDVAYKIVIMSEGPASWKDIAALASSITNKLRESY